MATYLYECPHHGEFEYQHSITENLEVCPMCEKEHKTPVPQVKRLIAGGTNFILAGGGWARDSYSK